MKCCKCKKENKKKIETKEESPKREPKLPKKWSRYKKILVSAGVTGAVIAGSVLLNNPQELSNTDCLNSDNRIDLIIGAQEGILCYESYLKFIELLNEELKEGTVVQDINNDNALEKIIDEID